MYTYEAISIFKIDFRTKSAYSHNAKARAGEAPRRLRSVRVDRGPACRDKLDHFIFRRLTYGQNRPIIPALVTAPAGGFDLGGFAFVIYLEPGP